MRIFSLFTAAVFSVSLLTASPSLANESEPVMLQDPDFDVKKKSGDATDIDLAYAEVLQAKVSTSADFVEAVVVFDNIDNAPDRPRRKQLATLVVDGGSDRVYSFSFDTVSSVFSSRTSDPFECVGASGEILDDQRVRLVVPSSCLPAQTGTLFATGSVVNGKGTLTYDRTEATGFSLGN